MKRISSLEDLLSGAPVVEADKPRLVPEATHGVVDAQQNARVIRRTIDAERKLAIVQASSDDLGELRSVLEVESQGGQIGIESYVMMQVAMRANPGLRDHAMAQVGPALESIDPGTEKITVGVEGLRDALRSVIMAFNDAGHQWLSGIHRGFSFITTRTLWNQRRMRKLRERAAIDTGRRPASGVTVELNTDSLYQDGKIPSQPAKAIVELAGIMEYMTSKYRDETTAALRTNTRAIGLIDERTPEAFMKSLEHCVKNWKAASVSGSQVNSKVLGGYRPFHDVPGKYTGTDPMLKRLDELATTNRLLPFSAATGHHKDDTNAVETKQMWPCLTAAEVMAAVSAHQRTLATFQKFNNWARGMMNLIATPHPVIIPVIVVAKGAAAIFSWMSLNLGIAMAGLAPLAFYPGAARHREYARYLRRAHRAQGRNLYNAAFDACLMELRYCRAVAAYSDRSLKAMGL